jgi:hypothetical protein
LSAWLEAPKQPVDSCGAGHRKSQRRRNAAPAKKCRESVFVLTAPDDGFAGKKGPASELVAKLGYHPDGRIARRDEEVDALGPDDPAQSSEYALRRYRDQIVAIRGRFLQIEVAVVAADDHQRRIAGLQAPDQVVARGRTGFEYEQSRSQYDLPRRASSSSLKMSHTVDPRATAMSKGDAAPGGARLPEQALVALPGLRSCP